MDLKLLCLEKEDLEVFKKDMQESFQMGAKESFDDYKEDCEILPEKDINTSLNNANAKAYKAVLNNEIVGGAIVNINKETNINDLDFLYVKYGIQSKGVGNLFGMKSKNYTQILKYGRQLLHTLKKEIFIFM